MASRSSATAAVLEEAVSLAELARTFHCSKPTMRRSLRAAGIAALIIGTGNGGRNVTLRFRVRDIQRWLGRRREPV